MTIDNDAPDRPGHRRRGPLVAAGVLGGTALLVGGLYVTAYAMAGENTPRNATVEGIAIGAMTSQQAASTLRSQIEPRATKPITVSADGRTVSIKPAEAGMTVDYEATVQKAGAGKSWDPTHIWNVLRGGTELELETSVDQARLTKAVTEMAPTFAKKPVDATVKIQGVKPVTTPASAGVALAVDKTVDDVRGAWMTSNSVTAPLTTSEPDLTTQEAEAVVDTQLAPLLSGPIQVRTNTGKTFPVDVAVLAAATTVSTKDSDFAVATDMEKVWTGSQKAIAALKLPQSRDATIRLSGGKPTVVPSVDGQAIKKDEFVKAVQPALTKTGKERSATVTVQKSPASFTTAQASKLGVKQVTGQFTTSFPYAAYRNTNLSRAAASINGTFVKPGEVFSLNRTLGERTPANGYVDGYVINEGKLVKETGGGVSQSATTTFNAAFFAGLEDVEHHPHTLYFPRYPAGREATVYYGALDLKFRNNTPYGVLMQAFVSKAPPGGTGTITVRIWSTKIYDVVATDPVKSNFTDGKKVESDDPKCEYQAPIKGFDVKYSRIFRKGGATVKTENFSWRYSPGDEIKCVPPKPSDS